MFPSPCGDYGSYLLFENIAEDVTDSFRPLAGIMVLILYQLSYVGLLFRGSFRPLAGIMVLIKKKLKKSKIILDIL